MRGGPCEASICLAQLPRSLCLLPLPAGVQVLAVGGVRGGSLGRQVTAAPCPAPDSLPRLCPPHGRHGVGLQGPTEGRSRGVGGLGGPVREWLHLPWVRL